jgi:hypothetical protein
MNQSKQQRKLKKLESEVSKLSNKLNSQKKGQTPRKKGKSKPRKVQDPYARMLVDPCSAPLVPGIFGSQKGYLTRLKSTIPIDSGFSSANYGYVIWYPDYVCSGNQTGAGTSNFSAFQFWGASGVSASAANFGLDSPTDTSTGHSFPDPAAAFCNSATVADARTVSACLEAHYVGTQTACSGLIYPLENIPLSFLYSGIGGVPPSFQQIKAFAPSGARPLDGARVVFRPSADSIHFRDAEDTPLSTTAQDTVTLTDPSSEVTGIGFLFWNTTNSSFSIEMTKNIEWRAETSSGFASQVPRGMDSPNVLARAISGLDRRFPNWQHKVAQTATDLAINALSSMALGGAGLGASSARKAIEWVEL